MCIRHLSRLRIHARIRRFWTFVFTSSPLPLKTLCVNGLSVKASPLFPSHLPSPKVLEIYAPCIFHSLSISRLQGKGEEVKVVFRKQRMRTRARKDGMKMGKVRRFSRIGHGFVLSTSKCNKSGSSDIWSDAGLKGEKR